MKTLLLAAVFFLAFALQVIAMTVQVGSGTATNYYFPIYTCYSYNYSQQIYLASEIAAGGGQPGVISKIRFFYTGGTSSPSTWNYWQIYLGNTTKSSFTSASDWIPVSAMTSVFNYYIPTPVAGTWLEIMLGVPFTYTGGNLVVAIDENSYNYACTANWRSYTASSNRSLLYFNDNLNPNPSSPPYANNSPGSTLSQIQFEMTTTNPYLNVSPNQLNFGYLAPGNVSASQSYTLSGGNLVANNVTITAPAGFEISLNNSSWTSSLTLPVTPPTLPNNTIYVRFEPSAPNVNYSSNVTHVCGTANRNMLASGNTGIYNFYCTSSSYYSPYFEIGNVSLGTLNNSSVCGVVSGYSNYSMTVPPPELQRTGTIPFSVTILQCIYNYSTGVTIFIDYNHNDLFDYPSDMAYYSPSVTAGGHVESGFITIPVDAVLGTTLMRIVSSSNPINASQCNIYNYGETEDYLVNITPAPPCPAPAYLQTTPYGHQALLSWTEMGTATSWDVEWGPASFTPTGTPTMSGLSSPNMTITGLTPLTGYSYYVRANCGNGYSMWTGPKNFTTTVSCPSPTTLTTGTTTVSTASIDWTSAGLESTWDIEYGIAGFIPGSGTGYTEIQGITAHPYILTGLNPSTQYEFSVRAECGQNDQSAWSQKGIAATLCGAISSFPWIEGFEGVSVSTGQQLPVCWSYENLNNNYGPRVNNSTGSCVSPHSGTSYLYSTYTATNWVFTPAFSLIAGIPYDFSFYMRNQCATNPVNFTMDVAYGAIASSAGMTHQLASNISCTNTTYNQFNYTVTPDVSGYFYFGIKITGLQSSYYALLCLDDFRLALSSCPVPASIILNGISNHSVQAGWTGAASTVQFDYGSIGHTAGSGTLTGSITSNPYIISGLTSNTGYDLFVRQDCGGGLYSSWQGPVSFTTLCDTVPSPFEEHFPAPLIPTCWSRSGPMNWDFQHVNPRPYFGAYYATDHTTGGGGNYAWVGSFGNTGLTGITLKSPVISLQNLTHPQLRFYLFNNNTYSNLPTDNQKLMVNLFAAGNQTLVFTWDYSQNAAGWQEIIVNLDSFMTSGAVQIIFVVDRGTHQPEVDDLLIDDIYIEEAPACPKPVALDAIAYSTYATLSWNSPASLFDVEFGPEGFSPSGNPTYPGVSNGFTVSPLMPTTSYSYFVRALCPPLTSNWAGPYTFKTPCTSIATPFAEGFETYPFPSACWTNVSVVGNQIWNQYYNAGGYGNSTRSAEANLYYSQYGYIYDLISPLFDTTGLSLPGLKFDYAYATRYGFTDTLKIYYSMNAGHDWILLDLMHGGPGGNLNTAGNINNVNFYPLSNQWATQTLQLPTGVNRVKFRVVCGSGNNLFLDNVNVMNVLFHDASLSKYEFGQAAGLGFIPSVTVKNEGFTAESFPVTLTISSWSSTKQVTDLLPSATRVITFDTCTLTAGSYLVNACTQLPTDQKSSNDCLSGQVKILDINTHVYAYCSDPKQSGVPKGPVTLSLNDPGTLNSISGTDYLSSVISGTWANGTWYAINNMGSLISIDPLTGVRTLLSENQEGIQGLAYNHADHTMYGVNGTYNYPEPPYIHYSKLFKFDLKTGIHTFLARSDDGVVINSLAIDSAGNAFTVNTSGSAILSRLNLSTAEVTPIGPIGTGVGCKSLAFDHETGNLFMLGTSPLNDLRLVDTATGNTLQINYINGGADLTAFGIPYSLHEHDAIAYGFDFGGAAGLGFTPKATVKNIGSATEDFSVTLTIGSWNSTRQVSGLASNLPAHITFDPCPLPAGRYPMMLCTQLGTDMVSSNDCISDTLLMLDLEKKALAYGQKVPQYSSFAPRGLVNFHLGTPGSTDTIPNSPNNIQIVHGTWANGKWYGCGSNYANQTYRGFVTIDTATGAFTLINPDLGKELDGMSYNPANHTLYGIALDANHRYSELYSINMSSGEITHVGTCNVRLTNLAISFSGEAFGIDKVNDYLGKVNLSNGLWTPIGSVGFSSGGFSELDFDRNTGNLFVTRYRETGMELRQLDPSTGKSLLIGTFRSFLGVHGFTIPYTHNEHDVAAVHMDFNRVASTTFSPQVTVMNEGNNVETFDVTLSIGSWSSVKTVASLDTNELRQVTFDACPLPPGDYPVSVCTDLSTDVNSSNDCRSQWVRLLDMTKRVYGYRANEGMTTDYGPVYFQLGRPDSLTPIITSGYYPLQGGCWANGIWYTTSGNTENSDILGKVDPVNGERTTIGLTAVDMIRLAYNPVSNIMYGVRYMPPAHISNPDTLPTKLYTINLETGAATLVGTFDTQVLCLAINNAGQAYSIIQKTNQLATIDLATLELTTIGDIGINSYWPSLAFDHETGYLFLNSGVEPFHMSSLWWVNTSTGVANKIGNYPGIYYIGGFAIPYGEFSHDAKVHLINFNEVTNPGFIPKAVVMNVGDTTDSFNVSITIGNWTCTKSVTDLIPFASQEIVFDTCALPFGSYSYSVCTQLTGDLNASNDCKSGTIRIMDLSKRIYGYCSNGLSGAPTVGPVSFPVGDPASLYLLGYQADVYGFQGGTWATGTWYALEARTDSTWGRFISVDTVTGTRNFISMLKTSLTEISYNPADNSLYGIAGYHSDAHSRLYKINMATGELWFIGNCPEGGILSGLAIDSAGNAYSVNATTDQLVKIDLSNGSYTPVGNLDFNAMNLGLDMEFDHDSGTLFMAVSGGLSHGSKIMLVDQLTGHASLIQSCTGRNFIIGLAVPYQLPAHDAAISTVDFNEAVDIGFIPKATVENTGSNTDTFDVILSIGSWSSTRTVSSLAPSSKQQVIFDACPLFPGDYPLSVCTQLASDLRSSNDCRAGNVSILNLDKKLFASCSGSEDGTSPGGTVSFYLSTPGSLNLLDNQDTSKFITGGSWANDRWYGTEFNSASPFRLVSFDTLSGVRFGIGDMGRRMEEISYNPVNNTLYGVSYDWANTRSLLCSIDTATGIATPVGSPNPGLLLAGGLAIDNNGKAYSFDLNSQQLGRIDLSTGLWTAVGPSNVFLGSFSNMEFDRQSGELFMSVRNLSVIQNELRLVDTATGQSLLIGRFEDRGLITGLAIPGMNTGPLTGIKFIPGDYNTIEAAIADLNTRGVGNGGVTFNVTDGHTETFTHPLAGLVTDRTGSATSPIVFQKFGTGANPLVTAPSGGTTTNRDFIICFAGEDHITFDGIDLQENPSNTTPTTQMEWGYALLKAQATAPFDGCQHDVIRNCHVTLNRSNPASVGIYSGCHTVASTSSLSLQTASDAMSYCKFYGNTISNVQNGISLNGAFDTAPFAFFDKSNEIGKDGSNAISDFGSGTSAYVYGIYAMNQDGLTIANSSISGNAFTSSTATGISVQGIAGTLGIYGNQVSISSSGLTLNGMLISESSTDAVGVISIHDNSISGCTGHANMNFNGINYHGTAYTFDCYSNAINDNIFGPGAGGDGSSFYGILVNSSSVSIIPGSIWNIHNNTLTGNRKIFTSPNTWGISYCYYINIRESGETLHIDQNIISDNQTDYVPYIAGIYDYASCTNHSITGNVVSGISGSNNSASVIGIYESNSSNTEISRNKVAGLSSAYTSSVSTPQMIGISATTRDLTVTNNFISGLQSSAVQGTNAICGLYINSQKTSNIYYNTIFLNATSSSATTFGSSGIYSETTGVLDLRNNLVVNTSVPVFTSGNAYTIAFRRNGTNLTTYGSASGHNLFYAGTSGPRNLIYFDGTNSDQTLESYKSRVNPRDVFSVTEMPPFINGSTDDLHLAPDVPTRCESGGKTVSSVTVDYENDSRNAFPDIGADEFSGTMQDLMPPEVSFTPMTNVSGTGSRTLTATITDPSGVPVSGTGNPMLYWKINSGTYAGAQGVPAGPGQYAFTLGGGVSPGDVISYYFVAQDSASTPNAGSTPSGGSGFSTDPPACSTPPSSPYTYSIVPGLSGSVTVGTGGIYPSLTGTGGLFNAVNSGVLNGNLTATVISDLTEPGTFALKQWTDDPTGSGFTLNIKADAYTERLVSGSVTQGMIRFDGPDMVTIDGRQGGGGSYLRFRNTATTGPTFLYQNDATGITLQNLSIEGSNTASFNSFSGVVCFSTTTGTTGNDNNTLSGCVIRNRSDQQVNTPWTLIYSSGTAWKENSSISVTGNNLMNFNYAAVYVESVGNGQYWNISGNSIFNRLTTGTSNQEIYGIRFNPMNSDAGGAVISGNYIGGQSGQCSGTPWTNSTALYRFVAISAEPSANSYYMAFTKSITVQDNTIRNISLTSTGNVPFLGIIVSDGGYRQLAATVTGNTVGHPSSAGSIVLNGSGYFKGITVNTASSTVSGNVVANITGTGTAAPSMTNDGIWAGNNPMTSLTGNSVHDLSFAYPVSLVGINTGGKKGSLIDNNEVYNLTLLNASTTYGSLTGIAVQGTYGPQMVSKNRIRDLVMMNTGDGWLTGISGYYDNDFVNNVVSLGSATGNKVIIRGFSGYYGNQRFYYNSVSISGAATTGSNMTSCFDIQYQTNLTLQNNIFVNNRSGPGKHYAIAVENTAGSYLSGHNDLFTNGSLLGLWGTADQADLPAYAAATVQETGSISVDPLYTSVTDLHPTNMAMGKLGADVPEILYDINGTLRTHPPDMGAYEFSQTPLVITTGTSGITASGATLGGSINSAGLDVTSGFEYGLTTGYGSEITGMPSQITGTSPVTFNAAITGLLPATKYHFRARGITNGNLTVYGEDQAFTTGACVPAFTQGCSEGDGLTHFQLGAIDQAIPCSGDSAWYHDYTSVSTSLIAGGLSSLSIQAGHDDTHVTIWVDLDNDGSFEASEVILHDFQCQVSGTTYIATVAIPSFVPSGARRLRFITNRSSSPEDPCGGYVYGNSADFTAILTSPLPPSVITDPASGISSNNATFNGTVNANGAVTSVTFEYGTTSGGPYSYSISAVPSSVSGNDVIPITGSASGLYANTTYYYRIVGMNAEGVSYGNQQSFTTPAGPPLATTLAATLVQPFTARLNGTVTANGSSTTVTFEYGTTTSYGYSVNATPATVTGNYATSVYAGISGLSPGTLYHFRVRAVNIAGTVYGSDMTFTTPTNCSPTYTYGCSYNMGLILFQLNTINQSITCSGTPSYYHDYTATSTLLYTGMPYTLTVKAGYAQTHVAVWVDFNDDNLFSSGELVISDMLCTTANINYTTSLLLPSGSTPGNHKMRYRTNYAAVVPDACSNLNYGNAADFTVNVQPSVNPPTVVTTAATGITGTTATLNGTINANGTTSTVYFQYGLTASYGTNVNAIPGTVTGSTDTPVSASLTGLLANTTYHYRVGAYHSTGGATGNDMTFTTPQVPCLPNYTSGCTSGDGLVLFQLNTINQTITCSGSPSWFHDYTAVSTTMQVGTPYTLTVKAGYSQTYVSIWIDVNDNNIFENSELFVTNLYCVAGNTNYSTTITLPVGTLGGNHKLLYRTNWQAVVPDACTTLTYGNAATFTIQAQVDKNLNLTVFLEGLYDGGSTLRKAQNENGDQWSGSVADHVTVELHNASNYSMTEYTASNVDLNTDGTISLTIPGSLGGSYYITIRHRNSIETTTSNPVSFSTPTVSYQFDASSKAFGDNMKLVNGNYCIYGGDVNQDGIVDSSDMIPIDNLSSNFATGYISEDANGDGLVDSGDMIIVDNNSSNFVGAMTP